jgi:hypothetical protein
LTAVSDNSCDLTCDEGYIEKSSTHVCETGSVTFSAFSNSRVSDYQTVTLSKSYVVFESANREIFNIISLTHITRKSLEHKNVNHVTLSLNDSHFVIKYSLFK